MRFVGGAKAKTNLYKIIGGNTLAYTSENGIKKVATEAADMDLPTIVAPGNPATLPDGAGWAVSVDTGATVMIFNGYEALNNRDIYRSVVFCLETITVEGNPPAGETEPKRGYTALLPLAGL